MIRWTNYTGDKIVTIPKDKIMTITNASNEMSTSYEIIKNYDNLDKPKRDEIYQRKEFTDEENKKVNEIFKEFDDLEDEDEPTIHLINGVSENDTVIIRRKNLLSSVE